MTQNKVLCIYHGPGCADGLGAAWAVHRALGDRVEFVAAKYGDDPPKGHVFDITVKYPALVGRDILIVDFSYPLPVLRAMAQEARSVLVLDHHKTAQKDLAFTVRGKWEFSVIYGGDWLTGPQYILLDEAPKNLGAIFDLKRSGARITWDYLHAGTTQQYSKEELASIHDAGHGTYYLSECPECAEACKPITRPRIIDLIEDRDLWKFNFGDETRAFHAVLTSYNIGDLPAMFERLDDWDRWQRDHQDFRLISPWKNLIDEGRAILRANAQAVTSAIAATRRTIKIAGHVVPCANVPPAMASDAGHLLCQVGFEPLRAIHGALMDNASFFSATYYDGADGRRHFSLRSPEGGADVGLIAKQMAEQFNQLGREAVAARKEGTLFAHQALKKFEAVWAGGGHEHAAGFDAPLGWEGE